MKEEFVGLIPNDVYIANAIHTRFVKSGLFCCSSPRILSEEFDTSYVCYICLPFCGEGMTFDIKFSKSKWDDMDDDEFDDKLDFHIDKLISMIVRLHEREVMND